jgi:hypothetical protein
MYITFNLSIIVQIQVWLCISIYLYIRMIKCKNTSMDKFNIYICVMTKRELDMIWVRRILKWPLQVIYSCSSVKHISDYSCLFIDNFMFVPLFTTTATGDVFSLEACCWSKKAKKLEQSLFAVQVRVLSLVVVLKQCKTTLSLNDSWNLLHYCTISLNL